MNQHEIITFCTHGKPKIQLPCQTYILDNFPFTEACPDIIQFKKDHYAGYFDVQTILDAHTPDLVVHLGDDNSISELISCPYYFLETFRSENVVHPIIHKLPKITDSRFNFNYSSSAFIVGCVGPNHINSRWDLVKICLERFCYKKNNVLVVICTDILINTHYNLVKMFSGVPASFVASCQNKTYLYNCFDVGLSLSLEEKFGSDQFSIGMLGIPVITSDNSIFSYLNWPTVVKTRELSKIFAKTTVDTSNHFICIFKSLPSLKTSKIQTNKISLSTQIPSVFVSANRTIPHQYTKYKSVDTFSKAMKYVKISNGNLIQIYVSCEYNFLRQNSAEIVDFLDQLNNAPISSLPLNCTYKYIDSQTIKNMCSVDYKVPHPRKAADLLNHLYRDPIYRKEMGDKCADIVEQQLNVDVAIKQLNKVISQII